LLAAAAGLFLVAAVITGTTSWLNAPTASRSTSERDPQAVAAFLGRKVIDSQWSDGFLPYRLRNSVIARSTPGGLFPSSISVGHFIMPMNRANFSGGVLLPFLYLPDSNMFVTVQVLECLLETDRLGVVEIDDEVVLEAVEAVLDHRDRNQADNAPVYCFYSQERLDDGSWRQHPVNIRRLAGYVSTFGPPAYRAGQWIGLTPANEEVFKAPDIRDLVVRGDPRGFLNRFNMPPDADDTGLALTLGVALGKGKHRVPEAHSTWANSNEGLQPVMEALKKYAYRPDSDDAGASVIDPRTYFWLHRWIENDRIAEPALITTWMQHVYEGPPSDDRRSKMPLNVNNVDPTVASNMLAGLTAALLESCPDDDTSACLDDDTARMMRDTNRLISWAIADDIPSTVGDTALLYYPTRGSFFWSAARLLRVLEQASCSPHCLFNEMAAELGAALRGPGTENLLRDSNSDDGQTWWHGILPGGEDRLFATALIANALIDTWTSREDQQPPVLRWNRSTPEGVVTAVQDATRWVMDTIDAEPYPWLNACFSGSVKGFNTLPFIFPSNTVETHGGQGFHGVRGHIPGDEYEAKLAKSEAMVGSGRLGQRSDSFTHWCSPTLTRAVTMLMLAKVARLEEAPIPSQSGP
jgi:hypothetical protein